MTKYDDVKAQLIAEPKTWLVTGVAGFIGSNLLETLLKLNQQVVGLDNFATGYRHNLDEVQGLVSKEQWARFRFIEGDIRQLDACQAACANVDYVLHQAALGSVPRSINDPVTTNAVNIDGFLNMLVAARDAKIKSFIYAASSSTYGDHPALPKVEENIGNPLSPYAVTKYVNELYANVFAKNFKISCIGLRYFNVFGRRQDPNGAYAAVIPKWTAAMIKNEIVMVHGDGETSRDFNYIDNTVQANILAATNINIEADNQVYNIAAGGRLTLNSLYEIIKKQLASSGIFYSKKAEYKDFRPGDIKHSQANIDKAKRLLGYIPSYDVYDGIEEAMPWYVESLALGKK